MQHCKSRERGFTLIELVVVIVILGILAAFAIPRFVNLATQARQSAVQGLAGSLRSASALAHGLALASGQTAATGTIQMEGQTVQLAFGYPTAATTGISATVANLDGFTVTGPAGTPAVLSYTPSNPPATPANCQVRYIQANSINEPARVELPATLDCS